MKLADGIMRVPPSARVFVSCGLGLTAPVAAGAIGLHPS